MAIQAVTLKIKLRTSSWAAMRSSWRQNAREQRANRICLVQFESRDMDKCSRLYVVRSNVNG
jgi:hypothetical protein